MTVVLDSSALLALAEDHPNYADFVVSVMQSEACYLAAPSLVELYLVALITSGEQQAEHWLNFVEGPDFHVVDNVDHELIALAARALSLDSGLSQSAAYSAALARKMDVQLVAVGSRFNVLSRSSFCRVALPPLEP